MIVRIYRLRWSIVRENSHLRLFTYRPTVRQWSTEQQSRPTETFKLVFHCLREDLELVKEGKCRRRQNHSGFPETIVAILKMATASVLRVMTREKYVVPSRRRYFARETR